MDEKLKLVVEAGALRGLTIEPVTFETETRTSQDAAAAVGCEIAQIVKSLVFYADGRPVLFLVSGANRVDIGKAAAATGARELRRADAETARQASGFAIGATPPVGLATELDVYMDEDLLRHTQIWAAAGRPDSVFSCSPQALVRAADATICDLKET